jgi:hypothetical protein
MNSRLTLKEHSMTLSTDELLELARRVYPDRAWDVYKGQVYEPDVEAGGENDRFAVPVPFYACTKFDPSLTGLDVQQAQALEIIMAVFALSPIIEILSMRVPGAVRISIKSPSGNINVRGDDILTAASRALLAKE